jgi:hypothetical protein
VDYPKGDPLNPQTDEEFNSKYQDCSTYAQYDNASEIKDMILDLENIKDVGELSDLLRK